MTGEWLHLSDTFLFCPHLSGGGAVEALDAANLAVYFLPWVQTGYSLNGDRIESSCQGILFPLLPSKLTASSVVRYFLTPGMQEKKKKLRLAFFDLMVINPFFLYFSDPFFL